ncbi:hemolysin expression modulator Hha [Cronobacter sakazakii]|uniref:hemolysin expression modulator Hha n=1 Tax=Cronobacter sakazakii TaxID=28141 RepID=UPI0009B96BB0|nr:hemolysin expression modulator Hha [Cronobacter sakazakii]MDK1224565.1 hemolysin expression modulator Hha [Cronobacter turicensis]EJJ0671525.1 hemolysin expression modulator Hha [Cronobacter sakazakii]EMC4401939.1 hemolysin expression modulator Hha [Cronobacter sakazakii]KAB0805753.1 hemolysin expression modulator Hha [Cronobacter sakazakii]KAB0887821.1 hemolysin expression modulator Hha [Cronobacter sakazakii]
MNKQDWLFKLRKVTDQSTLEKIIERKEYSLTPGELIVFYSAADHRLAEITVGRLFDKVPAHIWRYVL